MVLASDLRGVDTTRVVSFEDGGGGMVSEATTVGENGGG